MYAVPMALLEIPDGEWEGFKTEQALTARQLSFLSRSYDKRPRFASDYFGEQTERDKEMDWRSWCRGVVAIDVVVRPGGVAVQRHPLSDYELVIRWHRDSSGVLRMTKIEINPDTFLSHFPGENNFYEHAVAFQLRVEGAPGRKEFLRAPRRRPAPGKPPSTDFYRRLLAKYEGLVNEGCRDPAAELARRMNANHSTVKSWLRRGRGHLAEERERERKK